MNKKGDGDIQQYVILLSLLLAVVVGMTLLVFFFDLRDDSYYKMKTTSMDIALIQEVIQVSPEPIKVSLKGKDSDFNIELSEDPCLIKVSKPDQFSYISYKCYNRELYLPNNKNKFTLSPDSELVFEKK